MLKIILFFLTGLIAVGCGIKLERECITGITFPSTRYPYPSHTVAEDTGFVYVTYKDSLSSEDSFFFAFSGYHFFKSFDENNLSLRPTGDIIVRLSYDSWGDTPFVLRMNCNEITLKIYESGLVYPEEQITRLNKIEQLHYNILERHFPLDSTHRIPERKIGYVDSLKNLYPELLSAKYYRQLKEKAINRDTLKMKYSVYKKPITTSQFKHFIQRLNQEEFWTLPHRMNIDEAVTDGGGYILEIHGLHQFRLITSSNCPDIAKNITKVCQEIIDLIKPTGKKMTLCY